MMLISENGFPVTKTQLLGSVQMLLKALNRKHPFSNGVPERSWLSAFLNRHPELSERTAQNLTVSRASISEFSICNWFSEVEKELNKQLLLNIEGDRVFNGDKSSFVLAPKGEKVFVKKGDKSVYNKIQNDYKECLTTLFVASASGNLAPPLVVFSYQRIPNCISENIPEGWVTGKSDSGWMDGENFYEYITNIFYPWLLENKIKFPVILYIDGHSSRLTMAVSDFCREKRIVLITLHPNATHLVQSLDVSFFHPVKLAWQKVISDWRIQNNGDKIKKEMFAKLLKKAVGTLDLKSIMSNGFKTTGLYPLSANAIDYNKFENKSTKSQDVNKIESPEATEETLSTMEKYIDPNTLKKFKEVGIDGEWDGDLKDLSFFMVWKSMQSCFI
ncbi:uncharacterized protein LOC130676762 [Microplitis mediator]|uniref:uncharacterized protein LOC130676762 n=1 Tax=Microplitis mediator TaxID=375433 RepID=UPI0025572EB3|nr:uncharacterized protein LOC130676762 [Microplitis mediator]